ncbi:MAG: acyl-CoA dehydrogenase family protein [Dehalococcoidia bacterium]|nr:acyl-CoA dehydrogenase family protein [Dehalococcoidia bacterium]
MDFDLTPEQQALRQLARDFAQKEIAPVAAEYDEREEFPLPVYKKLGEVGILGMAFPAEYGGGGADLLSLAVVTEELSVVDVPVGVSESVNGMVGSIITFFGTQAQKDEWLPTLSKGRILCSFGLTEPGAGSDALAITTRADLEAGQWVINGNKCFITHAGTAMSGFIIIAAVTGRSEGRKEISCILVPNGTPGYNLGRPYRKVGWRSSDTRELSFVECAVPEGNLVGQQGEGFHQFMTVLDWGRIGIGAVAVGLARGCLEQSLQYAQNRVQFGGALCTHQAIQFKLAEMATNLEAARMMVHKAAFLQTKARPFAKEASMAKLFASEVAVRAAEEGVQIHGGYGYIEEYPIARFYRNSKILTIGEGTSEVQKMIIARQLGC